jgi:hypothetical protein
MSKENIQRINVSESYKTLDLGEVKPGTEKYKAMLDTIELAREREIIFFQNINQGLITSCDCSTQGMVIMGMINGQQQNWENKVKGKLMENEDNNEYGETFKKVMEWYKNGYDGDKRLITSGEKFRFLCEKFGVSDSLKETKEKREKNFWGLKDGESLLGLKEVLIPRRWWKK